MPQPLPMENNTSGFDPSPMSESCIRIAPAPILRQPTHQQNNDLVGPWNEFAWPIPAGALEGSQVGSPRVEGRGPRLNLLNNDQDASQGEAASVIRFSARDQRPHPRPLAHSSSIDLNRRTSTCSLSLGEQSGAGPSVALDTTLNPSRHLSHFPSGSNNSPLRSTGNPAASTEQLNALLLQWMCS